MKCILCFALLNLYYAITQASNPRSVNVALETSLLFQPGDENNLSFINKIRSFIDQIEQAITPVKAFLRSTDEKKNSKLFSKFIEKITVTLIKYGDDDLKEVAKALANEAEKFLETTEVLNENSKYVILNVLKEYSKVKPKQIRYNLQNALNGNEAIITKLANKIDNYYDANDKSKLDKFIEKTEKFSKERPDNAKAEIRDMIHDFINILKHKYDTLDGTTKIQINRDFGNVLKYVDLNKIYTNDNKKQEFKTKLAKSHKYENVTKNGVSKNPKDIIVSKDVEIFVKSAKSTHKVNDKNNSKENDLQVDSHSVDLSTVLDELNKS